MNEHNKRLLHVDDDPDIQEYVYTILKDVANVTSAATLAKARKFLQSKTFDVVLLDLTLPDGSGLELIQELSTNHPATPIIIFSSHDIVTPPGNVVAAFSKGHHTETALVAAIKSQLQ